MRLNLVRLEGRETPATLTLAGSVVTVSELPDGRLSALVDGSVRTYDRPDSVAIFGTGGRDVLTHNSSLPLFAWGRGGDDAVFGGTGPNTIGGGPGRDVVYALLGDNTVNVAGGSRDRVFTNDPAAVSADPDDRVARFFGAGRVPGSGRAEVENGVLYVTPPDGGSDVRVRDSVVFFDFGAGWQVMALPAGVHTVAYFGGAGDDRYQNQSRYSEAAYGGAGDDVLVGGFGRVSVLKGRAGDDAVIGRAGRVDLSGDGGADVLALPPGAHTARADALDVLTGAGGDDVILS